MTGSIVQQNTLSTQVPSDFVWQNRHTVGDELFAQGYCMFVRNDCTLWVRKPNGERYIVNPYEATCTCPAGSRNVVCKHQKALLDLVWLSATLLDATGKGDQAKRLWEFWTSYCEYLNAQSKGIH